MTPETESQLMQTLGRIDSRVDDMHDRLFGNGQPGFVATTETRLKSLENTEAKARGAFYTLSILFTMLTTGFGLHLFKGR
jgi:hypothetical protein